MSAVYPLSHDYFERAVLIGPVLKQPMTALISKWKISDTDDERSVYTGIQTVSVIWKLWVSSLFLCKFLSYIRPPVGEPKQIFKPPHPVLDKKKKKTFRLDSVTSPIYSMWPYEMGKSICTQSLSVSVYEPAHEIV